VIHIYQLGAAPEDAAFDTLAVCGPFDGLDAAGDALAAKGWRCRRRDIEPTAWESPDARFASIIETREVPVAS
jgi:hypothetical protein